MSESIEAVIARQKASKKEMRRLHQIGAPLPRKPRTDWKAKYEAERNKVLNEAIAEIKLRVLRDTSRPKPESSEGRAFTLAAQSAITALEMMKGAE